MRHYLYKDSVHDHLKQACDTKHTLNLSGHARYVYIAYHDSPNFVNTHSQDSQPVRHLF